VLCLALRVRVEAALTSDPPEAIRAAQLLLDTDPYDLIALALSLRAWQGASNQKGLARTYGQAQLHFSAVGEVLPDRWEEFLKAASLPENSDPTRAAPDYPIHFRSGPPDTAWWRGGRTFCGTPN